MLNPDQVAKEGEMEKTATVVFDGEVLRPEGPVDMQLNARYRITYESSPPAAPAPSIWDYFESVAGSVEAPRDWADEHDHYIHGTPKRRQEPES